MISLHKRERALMLSVWFRNFLLRADQIHQLNHAFVQIDQSPDRLGAAFSQDISSSLATCRGLLHFGNITIVPWPVLSVLYRFLRSFRFAFLHSRHLVQLEVLNRLFSMATTPTIGSFNNLNLSQVSPNFAVPNLELKIT